MFVSKAAVLLCLIYVASVRSLDYTGKQERWTTLFLAREMAADIKQKVKQTVDIRKEHGRFISYEVGFIIGQIREKYKLMMELYRICYNRITKLTNRDTPKIRWYMTINFFRKQEFVHVLAVEIDKLVEVLEKTNMNVVPFPSLYEPKTPYVRAREDSGDTEEDSQKALEEAVKSRYREEYLMRKLNSRGQSTTKKRFVDKWPVPGTWSLESY